MRKRWRLGWSLFDWAAAVSGGVALALILTMTLSCYWGWHRRRQSRTPPASPAPYTWVSVGLQVERGGIMWMRWTETYFQTPPFEALATSEGSGLTPADGYPRPRSPDTAAQRLGFYWVHAPGGRPLSKILLEAIVVPLWAPLAVALILPAAWALPARRRRSRRLQGLCPVCGYDLRGSPPDSPTCPECGAKRPKARPPGLP